MAPIIADETRQAIGDILLRVEQLLRGVILITGYLTLLLWDVVSGGFTLVWFFETANVLSPALVPSLGFGLSAASSAVQITIAHRIKNRTIKGVNPFVLVLAGTVMVLDTVLDLVGGSWFVGRIQPDQFSWAWFSGSGLALRAIIIFVTLLAAAQEYVSTLIADTLKG